MSWTACHPPVVALSAALVFAVPATAGSVITSGFSEGIARVSGSSSSPEGDDAAAVNVPAQPLLAEVEGGTSSGLVDAFASWRARWQFGQGAGAAIALLTVEADAYSMQPAGYDGFGSLTCSTFEPLIFEILTPVYFTIEFNATSGSVDLLPITGAFDGAVMLPGTYSLDMFMNVFSNGDTPIDESTLRWTLALRAVPAPGGLVLFLLPMFTGQSRRRTVAAESGGGTRVRGPRLHEGAHHALGRRRPAGHPGLGSAARWTRPGRQWHRGLHRSALPARGVELR